MRKVAQTHFVADHDDVFAVQSLQNSATFVTNANDLNVGIGVQIEANLTGNTSVTGTAQTCNP